METNPTTLVRAARADDTVTMLGLPGFAVAAAVDLGDELELIVRTVHAASSAEAVGPRRRCTTGARIGCGICRWAAGRYGCAG